MKFTEIIKEEGRVMTVNTCDWYGNECEEMQLSIMNYSEAFIDLSREEAQALRDKITEWLGVL